MSVDELKAVVDNATEEERIFLAAYLRVKSDDGYLKAEVTAANQRMDAGKSVSLGKVKEILGQLDKMEP